MKTILEHQSLIYIAIFLFLCFAILCVFLIAVDKKAEELKAKKIAELNKPKKNLSNFDGKKRFTKAPTEKKPVKVRHKY